MSQTAGRAAVPPSVIPLHLKDTQGVDEVGVSRWPSSRWEQAHLAYHLTAHPAPEKLAPVPSRVSDPKCRLNRRTVVEDELPGSSTQNAAARNHFERLLGLRRPRVVFAPGRGGKRRDQRATRTDHQYRAVTIRIATSLNTQSCCLLALRVPSGTISLHRSEPRTYRPTKDEPPRKSMLNESVVSQIASLVAFRPLPS